MVVGYTLSVEDSKSRMFSDDSCLPKCLKCGYRLDFFAHNASYRLRPNQYDLCATYDGQLIGSLAFKRFCERERYEGVRFRDFECDEVHVHVLIETVVPFDSERRQTRFENFCSACGNYESVVGATPSF